MRHLHLLQTRFVRDFCQEILLRLWLRLYSITVFCISPHETLWFCKSPCAWSWQIDVWWYQAVILLDGTVVFSHCLTLYLHSILLQCHHTPSMRKIITALTIGVILTTCSLKRLGLYQYACIYINNVNKTTLSFSKQFWEFEQVHCKISEMLFATSGLIAFSLGDSNKKTRATMSTEKPKYSVIDETSDLFLELCVLFVWVHNKSFSNHKKTLWAVEQVDLNRLEEQWSHRLWD